MRDRPQLRSKMKSLLGASAGSAILVVGGLQACETTTTSGNLLAPDMEETDTLLGDGSADDSSTNDSSDVDSWTSGNLLPPDTFEAIDTSGNATETTDAGGKDQ